MKKRVLLTVSICMLFAGINYTFAKPPVGGVNFQPIEPATAQACIQNYKNTVTNKFAEFYVLDGNAIVNMINSGATAIRLYNGIAGEGNKVAIMVPLDANLNNMTGSAQMPAMSSVWVCPPACDVTKTGATAQMMPTAAAKNAANSYNSNGNFEAFNAFIIYPAALTALKNGGATSLQIANGLTPAGARCIIYRGVNADGVALYFAEDASHICSRCTL